MIGYEYFYEEGFYFRKHMGAIIPLSMPHKEMVFSGERIRNLLKEEKTFFLRWDTQFDALIDGGWWHVIKDEKEDISVLPKKTRYQVRKGMGKYTIEKVGKQKIIDSAFPVYKETFASYATIEEPLDSIEFNTAIEALPPETEFWGVFEQESCRLIGFAECLVRDDACFYVSIWITQEAMKSFASYALFHEMNKHYLNERGLKYVSDGARSISHDTNIHKFLLSKFGFRKAYACLNVVYVPWFGLLVRALYPFRVAIKRLPGNLFKKVSIILFQEQIRRSCSSQTKALES